MTKRQGMLITAGAFVVAMGAFVLVNYARAASGDAWEEFRADVETKCLEAAQGAQGLFAADATAAVDPFGSESYGLALIQGPAKGAEDVSIRAICVYDKQARTVEMGGELPSD
jgi:hypothetical protein